jgi:BirA family biotin operon repressor/biotin-[acetyl-CoA-carboxylase] ligase
LNSESVSVIFRDMSSPLDIQRVLRETFVTRAEHHATLGSTNDRARQCAAEAAGGLPLLIVADQQTAGRGRGSNRWWTGRGGLAMSLLVDGKMFGGDRNRSVLVGLAAAVAVVEAVQLLLESHAVGLHWPNDVVVAERKLAGVLVEVLADRCHIIGIGVNTNNTLAEAPPELQRIATSVFDLTGKPHDPTDILIGVLRPLEDMLQRLSDAPEEIGRRAGELCLQVGRTLTVRSGNRSITGRAAGIAPDGALLLETSEGRRKLYSGVVQ